MSARIANSTTPSAWVRRIGAGLGVALLLLLTVSAASPALHHWLHTDGVNDAADNCAVVLFASGITLAATAVALTARTIAWQTCDRVAFEEIFLASPRYLRQPERGPPSLLS